MKRAYKSVVIKVGSNVLTHSNGMLDTTRLSSLVDQIVELEQAGVKVIIVSSGAVAAGRSELKGVKKHLDTISQRQLFSAVGQVKLINKYYSLFGEHNFHCAQVLTTKEDFSSRTHYLNQQRAIRTMLESSVVPIINENDTTSITELMFTDNDELSGLVATMMGVDALVILSNVDGLYDGDPRLETSKVIPFIEPSTNNLEQYIIGKGSEFGRGGMATKSRISSKVADEGIEVIIANGTRQGILPKLLLSGENTLATRFLPSPRATSSVKRWIAHSEDFTKGSVTINDKALSALLSPTATSLLAVGITATDGTFERGDIVQILAQSGTTVGLGRICFDSAEVAQMAGHHGLKPIIHYDYLYIEEQQ